MKETKDIDFDLLIEKAELALERLEALHVHMQGTDETHDAIDALREGLKIKISNG